MPQNGAAQLETPVTQLCRDGAAAAKSRVWRGFVDLKKKKKIQDTSKRVDALATQTNGCIRLLRDALTHIIINFKQQKAKILDTEKWLLAHAELLANDVQSVMGLKLCPCTIRL